MSHFWGLPLETKFLVLASPIQRHHMILWFKSCYIFYYIGPKIPRGGPKKKELKNTQIVPIGKCEKYTLKINKF